MSTNKRWLMTIDTELSDFNWHYLSQYGRIKFYVVARFWDAMHFDKAPIDPYRLACEYYARNGFSANPDDFYIEGNRVRYRSIDKLVQENPEKLSEVGQMLFASWLGFKKNLDATRAKEPELPKIEPPPPEPPKELPKVEEPKKLPKIELPQEPKAPTKTTWKLIATIAATVAVVLKFTPVPAFVIGIVDMIVKILQAIPS
jgi:hypothetical protein